jgi:galactokinase
MMNLFLSTKGKMIVLSQNRSRYSLLRQQFSQRFSMDPEFFARSPGRVNLIGEHIDYALYSVLPMAIDRDVIVRNIYYYLDGDCYN